MEHAYRCTVCTWRGTLEQAQEHAAPPSRVGESEARIQIRYEETQTENMLLGSTHPPICPACGNHTVKLALHRRAAAG